MICKVIISHHPTHPFLCALAIIIYSIQIHVGHLPQAVRRRYAHTYSDRILGNDEEEDFSEEELNVFEDEDLDPNDKPQDGEPQEYKPPSSLFEFLKGLDKENNSEDEGIEDYKIGGYPRCY